MTMRLCPAPAVIIRTSILALADNGCESPLESGQSSSVLYGWNQIIPLAFLPADHLGLLS